MGLQPPPFSPVVGLIMVIDIAEQKTTLSLVEWINDVRQATEETLLVLAGHLPSEAAEALLELATGGKPRISQAVPTAVNPFEHPDAQRRFRVMGNVEELERALEFPWDKWTVFLHPEQRQWVERS